MIPILGKYSKKELKLQILSVFYAGVDTLENRPPGFARGKSDFLVKPLSNFWTKKNNMLGAVAVSTCHIIVCCSRAAATSRCNILPTVVAVERSYRMGEFETVRRNR